jgi:hypothetical protein
MAGFKPTAIEQHVTIANPDLRATNTPMVQHRVARRREKVWPFAMAP